MSYTVYLFKASGTVTKTQQDKKPTYDECVKAVGGYIETIPFFTKYDDRIRGTAYANEEGMLKGLPLNKLAIKAWQESLVSGYDPSRTNLCGDIILYFKDPK